MKKILFLMLSVVTLLFVSCDQPHHRASQKTVHSYTQNVTNPDGTTSLLYWYLLTNSNGHYYYYSSPTPVTSFSNVTWTESSANPITGNEFQATSDVNVSNTEFSPDMQSNFTESSGFESPAESSPSSSESGGFDGGSSSSSSGDSGGGGE